MGDEKKEEKKIVIRKREFLGEIKIEDFLNKEVSLLLEKYK